MLKIAMCLIWIIYLIYTSPVFQASIYLRVYTIIKDVVTRKEEHSFIALKEEYFWKDYFLLESIDSIAIHLWNIVGELEMCR